MTTQLQGRLLAGRYRLESPIASGGMAHVWKARDEVLGRAVAVKVLQQHLAEDEQFLERFRLEAVTAARLSHPAVVRIFDTGMDEDTCFIVMELFEGETLSDRLRDRGTLPPADAVRIARGILDGLAHAHAQGVIHRDVKPGNVLLHREDVKVADFGIAKAAFARGDATTTGQLLGTASYLAPEQVAGEEVDHRADLYATGIVLYEMLTGRTPFQAESPLAVATLRLTRTPPPPGGLRAGIPRQLDRVVMRALARDPDRRYATAEEMSSALDGLVLPTVRAPAAPAPAPARSAPPSVFRSWMLVPLALVVLAAAAVLAGVLVGRLELGGPLGVRPRSEDVRAQDAQRLPVAAVDDHDPPPGDGDEHGEDAPNAADGNPESSWDTESYTSPDLGGIKDGVGIVLDLGRPRRITGVRIATDLPGWTFQLRGSADGSEFSQPIPDRDGRIDVEAEEETSIELVGVHHRYLMVWITQLAEDGGDYRAAISEVEVFGG